MRRRLFILLGVIFAMSIIHSNGYATSVLTNGGYPIGIEDLNVNGTLYDVQFVDGTFESIYTSGLDVSSYDDARAIGNAIVAVLNDTTYTRVVDANSYRVLIPWTRTDTSFGYVLPNYSSYSNQWQTGSGGALISFNLPDSVYGRVGPVPIPGAIWMLGAGLAAILPFRKRLRRG